MVVFKTGSGGRTQAGIGLNRREIFQLLFGGSVTVREDPISGIPDITIVGGQTDDSLERDFNRALDQGQMPGDVGVVAGMPVPDTATPTP